jgi:hypothetical protein
MMRDTSVSMPMESTNSASQPVRTSAPDAGQPPPVWHSENVMLLRRSPGITVLAFAGIAQAFGGVPPFNFVRAIGDTSTNVIFVRDPNSKWFGNPITGLGANPREMSEALQQLTTELGTRELCLLGISAGAFAALLFSGLLRYPCRVLAFSPQTNIHSAFLARIGDRRYNRELQGRIDGEFEDVLPMIASGTAHRKIHVVLGRQDSLDAQHVRRIAGLPAVRIHTLNSGHNTAGHLKRHHLLRQTLLSFIEDDEDRLANVLAQGDAE